MTEDKSFGFERIMRQLQENRKHAPISPEFEEAMAAVDNLFTPQVMMEILTTNVYTTCLIYQEMRYRFAPAVPADVLYGDVLMWTARWLEFSQKTIHERNPKFSDGEHEMVDILLKQFFTELGRILSRDIDTAEGDDNEGLTQTAP